MKKTSIKTPEKRTCCAPGCFLPYSRVLNNGQAYCRYHHGVNSPERVSEITRRLHVMKPVIRQIRLLFSLNASQIMGVEPVPVEEGLPADCRRQEGETFDAWSKRLVRRLDWITDQETTAA